MSLKFVLLVFALILLEKIEGNKNWTCSLSKKAQSTIAEWQKISKCMDRDEVAQYYCKTLEHRVKEWDEWNDRIVEIGDRVSSKFGLVGSTLTVWLLFSPKSNKRFGDLSFTYLKIIAVLELMEKGVYEARLLYRHYWRPIDRSNYALEVFNRMSKTISRGCTMYIDVVTLGMSIERVFSLWSTKYFTAVHNKKFLLTVNLAAALTIPLYLPRAVEAGQQIHFKKDGTCCKKIKEPWSGPTVIAENIRDGLLMVVTVLILISSIAIIVGLRNTKKNRDKLLRRRGDGATTRQQRVEEKERKSNVRLSVLLLSLSVPVMTYGTLDVFDGYFQRYLYLEEKAIQQLCYEDAIDHLNLVGISYLVDMFQDLIHRLAHDSNFYLYILFFLPFREALVQIFRRKSQVQPSQQKQGTQGWVDQEREVA